MISSTRSLVVATLLAIAASSPSSRMMVDAEATNDIACPGNCEPNGECIEGTCKCDSGFAGADCSFPFVICPNGELACFDGAICKSRNEDNVAFEDRHYQCDCRKAFDESKFAIEQCENPDSMTCEEDTSISEYAFCTNGGTCREVVRKGEAHAGCNCPPDFEGRHCQYAKGTAPAAELALTQSDSKSRKAKVGSISDFLIAIIVIGVVGFFGFMVYKKTIGSPGTTSDDSDILPPSMVKKSLDDTMDEDVDADATDSSNGEMA
eukprot:CAMPEP_0119554574 /NCGR_PEP_ID=MMETSP1352-20130426/7031_1 /TAXON_ID=265584 /ORGANISM="Stauroneis constricta, Strain CCMP1120" /LENGTH=263 /DNA_ID=CAMNT_0007601187 /DNA_START=23 /DNA_END=814 /DNA_ORIENTATION=+